MRCVKDLFSVFNLELNLLVKKNINPKRANNISSVTRFYNQAEKSMEYAEEMQKNIYKQDEEMRQCSEDAYTVLSMVTVDTLNMNFDGTDKTDNFVCIMPVSMYKRFKTWTNRYFKDEQIKTVLPPSYYHKEHE